MGKSRRNGGKPANGRNGGKPFPNRHGGNKPALEIRLDYTELKLDDTITSFKEAMQKSERSLAAAMREMYKRQNETAASLQSLVERTSASLKEIMERNSASLKEMVEKYEARNKEMVEKSEARTKEMVEKSEARNKEMIEKSEARAEAVVRDSKVSRNWTVGTCLAVLALTVTAVGSGIVERILNAAIANG